MKYTIAIALALTAPLAAMSQVTVFSDNFSGSSTVQSATPGAGTASSADYEVFTTTAAPAGETIGANDLHFLSTAGTSSFGEVEARFGGGPVALATVGDYINLTITFVPTANVMVAGQNSNSSLNIGLFNSGGVNLNQGGLLGAVNTTGGAQNYQGYVSRIFMNGNASSYNRASQTPDGTTSRNQDLLFNNASGSSSFGAPNGTTTTSTFGTATPLGNNVGLTAGNSYTVSYTIALTAANAVKITDQLFTGTDTNGTLLQNSGGTSTSGAFLGATFDSLGFGFRYAAAATVASTLDLSHITVSDLIQPTPEPSVLALSGLGLLALGVVRRFKNQQ